MAQLTKEQRRLALGLRSRGWLLREIGAQLDCSHETVRKVLLGRIRPGRPDVWSPAPGRLTLADREEISLGLHGGETFTAIAGRLGRGVSSVSREVGANGGRDGYRAWRAHRRARERTWRPKPSKLIHRPLAAQVEAWLKEWWSPEAIACRLRIEFPDDPMMWVSHETIYQSLFVQGRGELRRELTRCLRTGRAQRRPRGRERRGRIPEMVMISQRPAEVADRAVPGHWEGDLILGKANRSAVGTLVERSTRYVMLLHLPDGGNAAAVRDALITTLGTLPTELRRSLTWDQGKEMARHREFSLATDIDVYFCDPHSPWQRGSNENTNGLLRQYFPKGTDLSVHTAEDLAAVAVALNTRPRKTLDWQTPALRLDKLLAQAH